MPFPRCMSKNVRHRMWHSLGTGVAIVATTVVGYLAAAGSLTDVAPRGASAQLPVQISGTGMDAVATNNTVIFIPPTGEPKSATPTKIASIANGRQNLTVTVPSGLPIGPVALRVLNTKTKE